MSAKQIYFDLQCCDKKLVSLELAVESLRCGEIAKKVLDIKEVCNQTLTKMINEAKASPNGL